MHSLDCSGEECGSCLSGGGGVGEGMGGGGTELGVDMDCCGSACGCCCAVAMCCSRAVLRCNSADCTERIGDWHSGVIRSQRTAAKARAAFCHACHACWQQLPGEQLIASTLHTAQHICMTGESRGAVTLENLRKSTTQGRSVMAGIGLAAGPGPGQRGVRHVGSDQAILPDRQPRGDS